MSGFKSKAQMEKFKTFVGEGKITQEDFDKMMGETDVKRLPERLHEKKEKKESK